MHRLYSFFPRVRPASAPLPERSAWLSSFAAVWRLLKPMVSSRPAGHLPGRGLVCFLLGVLLLGSGPTWAQSIDPTFNPTDLGFGFGDGSGVNTDVYSVVVQGDGKILIGGGFTRHNSTPRNRIARLNANNTLDLSFDPGSGANGAVNTMVLQGDGKILIAGGFSSYNGTARNGIARLNADGSLDTSFDPGSGTGGISKVLLLRDGKILIAGNFNTYNGTARNVVARLNADGSLDPGFDPGSGPDAAAPRRVFFGSVAVQGDGKVLIGGSFETYNGTDRSNIVRLNADGSLDPGFDPGFGANNPVLSVAVQGNGKILIGGFFSFYNGTDRHGIARLNADGRLDTSFDPGLGTGAVSNITVQGDGRILIGGGFDYYNGTARNGIARVNADGSLDTSFETDPGTNTNSTVYSVAVQGDGKVLIGGNFTSYNGYPRSRIARLNTNGSLDPDFNAPSTGVNGPVQSVALQGDGKILIAGYFTRYYSMDRIGIARLNADGSLDTSFDPGRGTDTNINNVVVQADGKVLITGSFNVYNRTARNGIARLNADGSLDTSFDPGSGANFSVTSVAVQGDGKVLIGGAFTTYNGTARNGIARLNTDGSLDTSFDPGTGVNNGINSIVVQGDGKILIGGRFISYNGTGRGRIARVNADGSLDAGFNPGSGVGDGMVNSIVVQADGRILIGGYFGSYNGTARFGIARVNADGRLDTSFDPGSGANGRVFSVAVQGDDRILIGGDFTTYNGTARNYIARLNADGSLDTSFDPGSGFNYPFDGFTPVLSIVVQRDGRILIGGSFTGYNGTGRNRIARLLNTGPTITGFTARPNPVCAGSPATFTATIGNVTGSYSYTLTNGTSPLSGTATGAAFSRSLVTTGSGPQTFTLTVTTGGGTATAAANLTVTPASPDYQPLVDLYNRTNGANWTNKTNWLTGCTPCGWYGVTCTNGRVTRLNLIGNSLVGTLPASLSALTSLQSLELGANALTGGIPTGISNLTALQTLNLSRTQLGGTIPASLGQLTRLQNLLLNESVLTGSLPPSLGTLAQLQNLQLYTNQLSGCFPGSYTALCGRASVSFAGNSNLPGGGNFGAFCSDGTGGPLIVNQGPQSGSACVGSAFSFSVVARGAGSYQWYKFGPGQGQFQRLAETGPVLSFSSVTAADAGTYQVYINYGCGDGAVQSDYVTLTVPQPGTAGCPQVNTTPVATANASQTATVGRSFSYTVNAFNDAETPNSLTYSASLSPASGLSFDAATRAISGTPSQPGPVSVTVTATNGGGLSASTSFTITVNPRSVSDSPLRFSSLTASPPTLLTTETTSLSATVAGGTSPYSYSFSGPGTITSTGNTATVSGLPTGVQTFTVLVTDASSPIPQTASATVSVTVSAASTFTASLSASPSTTLTCAQTSLTLTAGGSDSPEARYAYSSNVVSQGGNTAVVNTGGVYSVTVTDPGSGYASTASITIDQETSVPTVTLSASPSTTLTCAQTSLTLTASGGNAYAFSPNVASQNGNTAVVNTAGVYSVTVINESGCFSTTSITVSQDAGAPAVSINPNSATLTCTSTTISLTAVGVGNVLWSTGSTERVITVNTAGTYSVTITNGNGCSTPASVIVSGDQGAPTVTITGSLTVVPGGTTTLTASGGGSYRWSTGQTTPSISATAGTYSVTATTANGCFATASATVTTSTPANTAPTVDNPVSPQSATVGVGYTLSVANTFTDAQTPNSLSLTVAGLPANLSLSGTTISGTPSTTAGSPYSVTLTATDPGGLSGSTVFSLSVSPVVSMTTVPTAPFAITGVTTIDCTPVANRVNLSFNPQYAGLNGTPVSFSVANELAPTTDGGPYTLSLYADNPVITLRAVQAGVSSSFTYNWLTACRSLSMTPGGNTPPTVANAIPPQSATVGQGFSYVVPANTFTDAQTPGALALSVTGLPAGLSFTAPATISGTPSGSGVSSVTVTATDPGNLSVSTSFTITVSPASMTTTPTGGFALTGVTTVSCTPVANRVNLSFNPQYAGLTGSPVSFQVLNELAPTTDPGPYSLTLYPDNPVITLRAVQSGVSSSFTYNWLAACRSLSMTPGGNTPPTVSNAIPPQSATVGMGYTLSVANTFTDAQTPSALVLSATGLPAGLNLVGTTISGVPSMSGVSSVTVTASDPGNLSVSTTVNLTVSPASMTGTPTGSFALTGVTTLNCTVLAPGQRSVSFNPRYVGLDGTPVRFEVLNELAPTTNPGPYSLNLYTDNPVITLRAVQSGVSSSFTYNWLEACRTLNVGSRQASSEPMSDLSVRVLGNPTLGETVGVEIRGGGGQRLLLTTSDSRGRLVSEQRVELALAVETQMIRVGPEAGVYILQVSTPSGVVTTKILRR